jgi:hypothetical protein
MNFASTQKAKILLELSKKREKIAEEKASQNAIQKAIAIKEEQKKQTEQRLSLGYFLLAKQIYSNLSDEEKSNIMEEIRSTQPPGKRVGLHGPPMPGPADLSINPENSDISRLLKTAKLLFYSNSHQVAPNGTRRRGFNLARRTIIFYIIDKLLSSRNSNSNTEALKMKNNEKEQREKKERNIFMIEEQKHQEEEQKRQEKEQKKISLRESLKGKVEEYVRFCVRELEGQISRKKNQNDRPYHISDTGNCGEPYVLPNRRTSQQNESMRMQGRDFPNPSTDEDLIFKEMVDERMKPEFIRLQQRIEEINKIKRAGGKRNTRINRKNRRSTRRIARVLKGGGLREDALAYLKKEGKEPSQLLLELHKRNPNGSYTSTTKTMGGFTFKSDGHPAQSMTLKAKKENNANDKYEHIFSYSDH